MPINQFAVRAAGTVAALALSLTLAACGGNTPSTPNSPAGAASTAAQPSQQFNDNDVHFTQMMIPHHRQAIAMAEMATGRAQNPDVKALAQQIKNEQDPEIQTMTGFLKAWGAQVPQDDAMSGMDHSSMSNGDMTDMSGMMSPEEMTQLSSASGTNFDRMFLQMMIAHHQGAVTDAQQELSEGMNEQAKTLASSIVTTQTAEINRMQQLLPTL
ncbi:DUF305 domain-containing protein [Pseudonocardia alaniniphila]|uniref:DUF305 domain-containing protein n=1 Tax=Pseudonocardia alaniniphila TaxID=75291 RepID=A0ABS9TA09_9PSEU|nr:DUF305 domain-containing protein [Pseudonocardia alaniniphila]MCH6165253.1 DUF305 domain-containing protein [Pseudonocardia alaniniphila]